MKKIYQSEDISIFSNLIKLKESDRNSRLLKDLHWQHKQKVEESAEKRKVVYYWLSCILFSKVIEKSVGFLMRTYNVNYVAEFRIFFLLFVINEKLVNLSKVSDCECKHHTVLPSVDSTQYGGVPTMHFTNAISYI